MFTPQAALTNNGTESAQETPSNTGGGNNVTASLLPTGKEDVSSVVKQASPAVVKIETLAKQSTRGSGQGGANTNDPLYQYLRWRSCGSNEIKNKNNNNNLKQAINLYRWGSVPDLF